MDEILKDSELDSVNGGAANGAVLYPYVIVRGDTLSGIAAKFGTTVAYLAKVNNIQNVNKIYAGKTIYVPHNR